MLNELLEQLAEAAVAEAIAVPKLMDRNGDIWWRARDGRMVRLTVLERGKQGYGAMPVHKAGLDWKRTANSLFEAWRVHELRALIAEQAALSKAFFVDEPNGDQ